MNNNSSLCKKTRRRKKQQQQWIYLKWKLICWYRHLQMSMNWIEREKENIVMRENFWFYCVFHLKMNKFYDVVFQEKNFARLLIQLFTVLEKAVLSKLRTKFSGRKDQNSLKLCKKITYFPRCKLWYSVFMWLCGRGQNCYNEISPSE